MPGQRPFCLCIAGPNGSGKSKLREGLARRYTLDEWIDPDQIAVAIALGQRKAAVDDAISRQAFWESRNKRVENAYHLRSFAFETVFSHGSNLAFLRALLAIGYDVHLYFVATGNPLINIERVRNRVELGGHSVPENKIQSRYHRSLQLLSLAVLDVHRTVIYDNSRRIRVTADGEFAGRLIGDVWQKPQDTAPAEIILRAPIPVWVFSYGLLPFSGGWTLGEGYREVLATFGDETHCDPIPNLDKADNRRRFLNRFLMAASP